MKMVIDLKNAPFRLPLFAPSLMPKQNGKTAEVLTRAHIAMSED